MPAGRRWSGSSKPQGEGIEDQPPAKQIAHAPRPAVWSADEERRCRAPGDRVADVGFLDQDAGKYLGFAWRDTHPSGAASIEWFDRWIKTGCTKISAGCDNCYAARFSERFRGVPGHPFETGFDLTLRPERLLQPLVWKTPRMIFVNSMSDLFHKEIPKSYIDSVFDTMEQADWHVYQVLTKRSSLLQRFINERYKTQPAPRHIWLGVSVENEQATSRVAHLQRPHQWIFSRNFRILVRCWSADANKSTNKSPDKSRRRCLRGRQSAQGRTDREAFGAGAPRATPSRRHVTEI
jgi:hypothetical protein